MSNHPPLPFRQDRILIADDDATFREPTAEFLRHQGWKVECATNVEAAKSLLGQTEFDLLISDICMPGNSGLELIRDLPQLAARLPVMLITSRPTVETAVESVRLGVVAYLIKPLGFEELTTWVGQALTQRSAWKAVNASRKRVEEWLGSLNHLEALLQRPSSRTSAGSLIMASMELTLQHVLGALSEVKLLTQDLSQAENRGGTLSTAAFLRATRETVEVLHRTKQSFKCKELAELRRRLEALLGPTEALPPSPTSSDSGFAQLVPEGEEATGGPLGIVRPKSAAQKTNKQT